jgi:hypothetical protein
LELKLLFIILFDYIQHSFRYSMKKKQNKTGTKLVFPNIISNTNTISLFLFLSYLTATLLLIFLGVEVLES